MLNSFWAEWEAVFWSFESKNSTYFIEIIILVPPLTLHLWNEITFIFTMICGTELEDDDDGDGGGEAEKKEVEEEEKVEEWWEPILV